ncbi:hypothetical protein chiPu_0030946, partial [Chiloscyllium punctatum]|nr:hypothetical protein [Chiloscyllium punctatum]
VEQPWDHLLHVGIVADAARGQPGQQTEHRHRHVGEQFRPDRLANLRDVRRFDRSLIKRRAQPGDALAPEIVAFADQEAVAIRRQIRHQSGRDHLVGGEDHAADDALLRDGIAQTPAGIEEAEIGNRGMLRRQTETVPPGNAVLREHDCGVPLKQRQQSGCERTDAGGLQRADDDVLRPQLGRIGRRPYPCGDAAVADLQRQSVGPDRIEMRVAHHAGHLVAGTGQPDREMA